MTKPKFNINRFNNIHNLSPGDTVTLDKEHRNSSTVKIVSISPKQMFSMVVPAELENPSNSDMWEVRTNRLTPLNN